MDMEIIAGVVATRIKKKKELSFLSALKNTPKPLYVLPSARILQKLAVKV